MNYKLDTSAALIDVAQEPIQLLDNTSKLQKKDQDANPIWILKVTMLMDGDVEVLTLRTTETHEFLKRKATIRVGTLVLRPYEFQNRSGFTLFASDITLAGKENQLGAAK